MAPPGAGPVLPAPHAERAKLGRPGPAARRALVTAQVRRPGWRAGVGHRITAASTSASRRWPQAWLRRVAGSASSCEPPIHMPLLWYVGWFRRRRWHCAHIVAKFWRWQSATWARRVSSAHLGGVAGLGDRACARRPPVSLGCVSASLTEGSGATADGVDRDRHG